MTNLEKFQEVFGITIDDRFIRYQGSQCRIIDLLDSDKVESCTKYATCHECPLFKFWEKEYVEKEDKKKMNSNEPITGYKELDDALNSIPSDELDRMLKAEAELRKRKDELYKMTEEESEKRASNHEFSDALAQAALDMFGIDLKKGEGK